MGGIEKVNETDKNEWLARTAEWDNEMNESVEEQRVGGYIFEEKQSP